MLTYTHTYITYAYKKCIDIDMYSSICIRMFTHKQPYIEVHAAIASTYSCLHYACAYTGFRSRYIYTYTCRAYVVADTYTYNYIHICICICILLFIHAHVTYTCICASTCAYIRVQAAPSLRLGLGTRARDSHQPQK